MKFGFDCGPTAKLVVLASSHNRLVRFWTATWTLRTPTSPEAVPAIDGREITPEVEANTGRVTTAVGGAVSKITVMPMLPGRLPAGNSTLPALSVERETTK